MEVTSAEQALHSLEIAELPIANPLRCFRMFGDSCSEARRAKWGTVQIANGVAWLWGEGPLAIAAIALTGVLGLTTLASYSLRRPRG
jgi:hypothetical protein